MRERIPSRCMNANPNPDHELTGLGAIQAALATFILIFLAGLRSTGKKGQLEIKVQQYQVPYPMNLDIRSTDGT